MKYIPREDSITVGYNRTGQDFFDVLSMYKKYIHEYFFSLTRSRLPFIPFTNSVNDELNILSKLDAYGIKGNLLLNTPEDALLDWKHIVDISNEYLQIQSVTVYDFNMARYIRSKYPNIEIHLSTNMFMDIQSDNHDIDIYRELIDVINPDEANRYKDRNIINALQKLHIKTKYIVNRECIIGKYDNILNIVWDLDFTHCCMQVDDTSSLCMNGLEADIPYINFIRSDMYKESLQYEKVDYIKLSTREILDNTIVRDMIQYWCNSKPTNRLWYGKHIIPADKYPIFLEWIKTKSTQCISNCVVCGKCKQYYEMMS